MNIRQCHSICPHTNENSKCKLDAWGKKFQGPDVWGKYCTHTCPNLIVFSDHIHMYAELILQKYVSYCR